MEIIQNGDILHIQVIRYSKSNINHFRLRKIGTRYHSYFCTLWFCTTHFCPRIVLYSYVTLWIHGVSSYSVSKSRSLVPTIFNDVVLLDSFTITRSFLSTLLGKWSFKTFLDSLFYTSCYRTHNVLHQIKRFFGILEPLT